MDNLTRPQRRKNMQNIRSRNTVPERMLTRALRSENLYFARNASSLPGKPDIVFRRKKVAVFVDSDFWHCNPRYFIMPRTNVKYWKGKIAQNKKRDKEVNYILRKSGWKVVRIWEHEIKKNPEESCRKIIRVLSKVKQRVPGI